MLRPEISKKDNLNKKLQLAGEHLKALAAENEEISIQLEEYTNKELAWEAEKSIIVQDRDILLDKNLKLSEEIETLKLELFNKNQESKITFESSQTISKESQTSKFLSLISFKTDAGGNEIPTKPRSLSADYISDSSINYIPLKKSITLGAEPEQILEQRFNSSFTHHNRNVEHISLPDINTISMPGSLSWEQFSSKLIKAIEITLPDTLEPIDMYTSDQLLELIIEHKNSQNSNLETLFSAVDIQFKDTNFKNNIEKSDEHMEKLLFALQNIKKSNVELDLPPKEKKIVLELNAIVKQAQKVKADSNILDQYNQVVKEKKQLEVDYEMLLEKVGKMQTSLLAKMKVESKEAEELRSQLDYCKETIAQNKFLADKFEQDKLLLENKIKHYEEELLQNHETIVEMRYQLDIDRQAFQTDIRDLETSYLNKEKDIERYKLELESSSAYIASLKEKNSEIQADLSKLLADQNSWTEERNVQNITIQNLQSALENLQMGNESEVRDILDQLHEEKQNAENIKNQLREKVSQLESEITKLTNVNDLRNYENLKSQLAEQSSIVSQLRQKIFLLNENLTDTMRRLKEGNDENMLDKRVITSLLVSFFSMSYGDSKRYEVLQLIANILQLDEQQKQKIGLIRKAGKPTPARNLPSDIKEADINQSISDMWISFLLRESSNTNQSHN
ncbi:hypothetical protein BB561_001965 [Smittium simulii]|uniref:GRIP domain-containing protein n=1 Tax=Smittium simulii TaxID=133385 RepID=A0A2T9YS99_9FUNG|nr:hypothetical protein BB561_001965 [Smittium simulii]